MQLNFQKQNGMIPVVVQDFQTLQILMLAYTDETAFQKTLETGEAHYYSRSKQRLWKKGESSGHIQKIHHILMDCDEDSLIFQVEQVGGAACHTGYASCFYRHLDSQQQWQMAPQERVFDPEVVYP